MYAGRIGEFIGMLAVLLLIAYAILFVNRKRKDNPTPYIAAGVICGAFGGLGVRDDNASMAFLAILTLWMFLLWRYKRESGAAPSVPGRINAVWLCSTWMLSMISLGSVSDPVVSAFFSVAPIATIVIGVLSSWVLMARKPKPSE